MKKDQSENKKNWLKWLLLALFLIITIVTYSFLRFEKESKINRENMAIQQEKMMSFWKSEGLTQDEIDQKLKEQRSQFVRNENPSIFQSVFRTVRHATGTGPGVRTR